MRVLVPTIPHTGSTSTVEMLRANGFYQVPEAIPAAAANCLRFQHTFPGDGAMLADHLNAGHFDLAVVPLLHPHAVAKSWRRRGKAVWRPPARRMPGRSKKMASLEQCVLEMQDFLSKVPSHQVYWMPLDHRRRESCRQQLAVRLGQGVAPDWEPKGLHPDRRDVPLTDTERLLVRQWCNEPPFERFYGDHVIRGQMLTDLCEEPKLRR